MVTGFRRLLTRINAKGHAHNINVKLFPTGTRRLLEDVDARLIDPLGPGARGYPCGRKPQAMSAICDALANDVPQGTTFYKFYQYARVAEGIELTAENPRPQQWVRPAAIAANQREPYRSHPMRHDLAPFLIMHGGADVPYVPGWIQTHFVAPLLEGVPEHGVGGAGDFDDEEEDEDMDGSLGGIEEDYSEDERDRGESAYLHCGLF